MGLSATIAKQASNQGLRFMWFGNYRDWITNNGGCTLTVTQHTTVGVGVSHLPVPRTTTVAFGAGGDSPHQVLVVIQSRVVT